MLLYVGKLAPRFPHLPTPPPRIFSLSQHVYTSSSLFSHLQMVGKQARAFFMIFYLIVVLVFMNVVVAYIIDSFQKAFPILQRRHERLIAGLPPDFECEVNVHRR